MSLIASAITILCVGVSLVTGRPTSLGKRVSAPTEPDPKFAVSVNLNGVTFVNKVRRCRHISSIRR